MTENRSPLLPLAAFAAVFGVLEAAVVVDLRRLVDPAGTLFPLVSIPADLYRLEQVREAATLVLLAVAAHLAGRDAKSRFASLLVVFGMWDVAFYAALRVAIGWPPSLGTWDLLFLLPRPWLGPVYAPLVTAAVMVGCGGVALRRLERGLDLPVGWRHLAGAAAGGAIVISSFLRAPEDARPPDRYRVELLVAGLAIGIAAFADLLRASRRARPAPPSAPATVRSGSRLEGASSSVDAPTSIAPGHGAPPPRAGG